VAKTLLLETNYVVKQIAAEVGCASIQNFSVLFRRMTSDSPSRWRSRHCPHLNPELS
jgi:transcriptional regulator GlxA family with amidase domain